MAGWVLFRAETAPAAWAYWRALAGWAPVSGGAAPYLDGITLTAIAAGIIGAAPIGLWLGARMESAPSALRPLAGALQVAVVAAVLVACMLQLGASTHNPFIYFRF